MKVPPPPDIRALGEYQVVKTIGSGSTGKVQMGIHAETKEQVAIKSIIRQRPGMDPPKHSKESTALREKRIYREASILYLLKHPHIVSLKDFFVCEEYFCMIFEYIEGVQLLDYITGNGKLKEKAARKFTRQMVSAIDYCHQNSIAHRDLKIENMLVDLNGNIKILDFGLSNYYNPEESLKTFCGSLYFAAPELLMGRAYTGPEVDVWALGVVIYVMVCGKVPFDDKSLPLLHDKIKRCDIQYPSHLSPECKDLLQRMINGDPTKRATISEVINHPWLNQGFNFTVRNYFNERVPLDRVEEVIQDFLIKEFRTQYTATQIVDTLEEACRDWAKYKNHPLISLYYLVRDKLVREGVLIPQAHRPLNTRSPSCPDLVPPPEAATQKLQASDARRTRNVTVTITPPQDELVRSAIPEGGRLRSHSLTTSIAPVVFSRPLDEYEIKTVYLKGLFSTNSTTKKTPTQLREDIARVLQGDAIEFENYGAVFFCEYQPSIDKPEGSDGTCDKSPQSMSITFEVHIVKVAVFGQFGVLFKRIQGDISVYKNLCSQILSQLDL